MRAGLRSKGVIKAMRSMGALHRRKPATAASLCGCVAAGWALALAATAAEPSAGAHRAAEHAATGAVVQYEEWGGGNVLYLEERGSMAGGIAPPAEALRNSVRNAAPSTAAAVPVKSRLARLPKLPRTEPPERP